jgi:long-subunit fatty acid transport protein
MASKFKSLLRRYSVCLVASALILLSLTVCSAAQDEHRYTLQGSAGVSPLVGDISTRLDNGWHITVGGGYNFTPHFTTTLDYTYNGFGVSRKVLNEVQVPDGNSHM